MTKDAWQMLDIPNEVSPGEWHAEAFVKDGSPWFSGHFPGAPILPGIAILALAKEVIRLTGKEGITLYGIKRVRFRQAILPGVPISIVLSHDVGDHDVSCTFRIMAGEDIACTGIFFGKHII